VSQKTAVFISSAVELSNRTLKTETKYWHSFFDSKVGHHLHQSPLLDLIISCLSSNLKAGTLAYEAGVLVILPRLLFETAFHTYTKCHNFFFFVGSCGLGHSGPLIFRIRFETMSVFQKFDKTACKRDRPIAKYRTAETKRQSTLCPEWCSN
jgi:hypothetical protein